MEIRLRTTACFTWCNLRVSALQPSGIGGCNIQPRRQCCLTAFVLQHVHNRGASETTLRQSCILSDNFYPLKPPGIGFASKHAVQEELHREAGHTEISGDVNRQTDVPAEEIALPAHSTLWVKCSLCYIIASGTWSRILQARRKRGILSFAPIGSCCL